jgi:hypothetical protein
MSRWSSIGLRRLPAAVLAVLLALFMVPTLAHELSMAEMQLRETTRGEFYWQWTAGARSGNDELRPLWPAPCKAEGPLLRCGEGGLKGSLAVDGVGKRFSAALIKVQWLDGTARVYTITAGQPTVQLFGSAEDQRGMGEIAWAYTVLGVEHILGGIDHLAFVMCLLFLVGFNRRLVATISAFTLAHSLTLGLSALGWLVLRPPPVEATIALSIVLVAAEALHQRQTLSRRWPALVALLFGLVHGLGFAGALAEIGLPQNHLLLALLSFNLGVEVGQLLALAAAFAVWWLLARWPASWRLRKPALYAIGSVAAYWSIARVASIVA